MNRRAYTLIELLIVTAIIAILIGILVPAVSYGRRVARDARCKTNLYAIAQAFHEFARNNDGRPPNQDSPVSWTDQLMPYGLLPKSFFCPEDWTDTGRESGISYYWRTDEAVGPLFYPASLERKNLPTAIPDDVMMVWEEPFNLHQDDRVNAASISTAVNAYSGQQFVYDLMIPVR